VALQAVLAQASFVEIFMAGYASLRDPQEGLPKVFALDAGALVGGNALREVALVAGQSRVLAFQHVTGFAVIEFVGIPLDQLKIRSVVVRVTARALLARSRRDTIGGVQPAFGRDARADVGMATDALELRLTAPDLVALRAVNGAVQKLVRLGQRTRRNLSRGAPGQPTGRYEYEYEEESL